MINKEPHPRGRVVRDVIAVFELDGAIANNTWRKSRLEQDPKSYYEAAKDDPSFEVGKAMVRAHLEQGDFLVFASQRPFGTADATSKWIQDQFGGILPFHDFTILMRRDDDTRTEVELKKEFAQFILDMAQKEKLTIANVYDPNPEVVEAYVAAGLNASVLNDAGLQSQKAVAHDTVTDVPFTDTPEAVRQDAPPIVINIGRAMVRLFPQGVTLRTEEDFNGHLAFISTLASMLKPE